MLYVVQVVYCCGMSMYVIQCIMFVQFLVFSLQVDVCQWVVDGFFDVDVYVVDGVDYVGKFVYIDFCIVVDVQVSGLFYGFGEQLGFVVGKGGIDFVYVKVRDFNVVIVWD